MSGSGGFCGGKGSRPSGSGPGRPPPIRPSTGKKRIRRLYRRCPPGAAVVCFDEWGPLELRPIGGVTWARPRQPARLRATYRRPHGTEQFLGFYDVHADCLTGLFRRRKRVAEVSEAFRRLRAYYPRRRLFVILDNLRNVHDHPRFLALSGASASSRCRRRPRLRG